MPLFMFVSGFCSYKEHYEWNHITKRTYQLLIPFFAYALVSNFIIKGSFSIYDIAKLVQDPERGTWFFWVLWLISIIIVCIDKLIERLPIGNGRHLYKFLSGIGVYVVLSATNLTTIGYGLGLVAIHIIYYTMGSAIRHYLQHIEESLSSKTCLNTSLLLFITSFCIRQYIDGYDVVINGRLLLILAIITASAGIAAVMCIVRQANNVIHNVDRVFTYLGQRTLGIYAIHLYIINKIITVSICSNLFAQITALFAIYLLGSLILYYIFDQFAITSKLLLGKMRPLQK